MSVNMLANAEDTDTIVLNGVEDIILLTNDSFNALDNVTAIDSRGKDITSEIQISGNVDTAKAGDYVVIYSVVDSHNVHLTKKRMIYVRELRGPNIIGLSDMTFIEGTPFDYMAGVEAYDVLGERLTNILTSVVGSLEEAGLHEVYYEVSDRWGHVMKHRRKITVIAKKSYFSDVPSNHMYFNQVQVMKMKGIINGYSDGTFKPNNQLTRAHAAVIMSKALGLNTEAVVNPNFKDVATTHPYYAQIAAIANAGIMSGKEGKRFDPDGTLTRGQMAVILTNAYQLSGISNKVFKDVPTNSWAYKYVQALVNLRYASGYTDGTFRPDSAISRVHFCLFLYNAHPPY